MRAAVVLLIALSGCLSWVPEADDSSDDGATLHPGMRLYFDVGEDYSQCTAGFMFATAEEHFLSVSAHCLHSDAALAVGAPVYDGLPTPGLTPIGSIAFDGWSAGDDALARDIALVRLTPSTPDRLNPSVPHWGGPLGAASNLALLDGTTIVAYGNSEDRSDVGSKPTEGWITSAGSSVVRTRLDRPAISGDSGGPLLTADGQALGMLHGSQLYASSKGGSQIEVFTPLDAALVLVQTEGTPDVRDVRLVTTTTWRAP